LPRPSAPRHAAGACCCRYVFEYRLFCAITAVPRFMLVYCCAPKRVDAVQLIMRCAAHRVIAAAIVPMLQEAQRAMPIIFPVHQSAYRRRCRKISARLIFDAKHDEISRCASCCSAFDLIRFAGTCEAIIIFRAAHAAAYCPFFFLPLRA